MKIHYKLLILDEKTSLVIKQVLEKNRKYLIDYCCEGMKQALNVNAIHIIGNGLHIWQEGYDCQESYYPIIGFCPFCGEAIEYVQEYKAKIERHTVHIPKKVQPAHTEMRNKEVKI